MSGADVVVVIPARNESELVEACLLSVVAAADHASGQRVSIVLVADACTDETAALARAVAGVDVIETEFGNVGAARAAGIRFALSKQTDAGWIANTDADSVVPPHWISSQVAFAQEGYQLMIGTVRPRFSDLTDEQLAAWRLAHDDGLSVGNIHGANLGVSVAAYRAAGGFEPIPEHEDVALVTRVRATGVPVIATAECEVETSGRLRGRTPGGYSEYLAKSLTA